LIKILVIIEDGSVRIVAASERHGSAGERSSLDTALFRHLGCRVLAAIPTAGLFLFVGVGTLFAVLSALGYRPTTPFVWLVAAPWVA
jgi:hypothetical protein